MGGKAMSNNDVQAENVLFFNLSVLAKECKMNKYQGTLKKERTMWMPREIIKYWRRADVILRMYRGLSLKGRLRKQGLAGETGDTTCDRYIWGQCDDLPVWDIEIFE